jgi:hypothetical protein
LDFGFVSDFGFRIFSWLFLVCETVLTRGSKSRIFQHPYSMKPLHSFLVSAACLVPLPAFAAGEETLPVYSGVVEKVINSYCIKCHTTEKKKGKLIMETYETLMKGGESAKEGKHVIVAGKSAESLMVTMLTLPMDDDLHMPPEGKPQPSAKEIAVLKWWIDAGAKKDDKLKDLTIPADVKPTVMELAAKKVERPAPDPVK